MVQFVSVLQVVRRFGLRAGAASLVLALIAVGLNQPGTAFAANFAPGDVLEVDTPALNVRSAAGTGSSVVTVLSGGTKVTIVEGPVAKNGYNWYKIAAPSGWLIGEGLAPVGSGSPGGNPGGTPGGSGYPPGTNLVVSTDALNLRSAPALNGSVLAVLPNGTAAVVVSGTYSGGGYSWYEITAWGKTGFAVGSFLAPAGSSGGGGGGGGQVPSGGKATVATNGLNVRASAGTGSSVVAVLPNGAQVSLLEGPKASGGYSWYRISSASGNGWVAGEFLSFGGGDGGGNSGGSIGPGSTAVVSDGPVNLRKSAGTGGQVITTIPTGTTLSVSDGPVAANGYSWVYVTTPSSASGWVAAEFLKAM